jgi:2-oxoglutarate dehydrogenase E2 component (dihydrolipoamide succinyltransferase)
MSVEIKVPALGESVSEATIAKWYKKSGDLVAADELLLELETEKVTLEVNAPSSGVIEFILKDTGATVLVGDVLGSIAEGSGAAVVKPAAVIPSPSAPVISAEASKVLAMLSPSAAKIATENKVDTSSIEGSGKDGRITKGDVLEVTASLGLDQRASGVRAQSSETLASSTRETFSDKPVERVRMSRLRKTIAQRLKDSQNTAAILTTFNEIDMTNVVAFRAKYREEFEKKHGIKLGFMSFFVKASVEALKAIPSVNAEIDGEDLVYKNYYDLGVAVGTEQGLVVPVLRGADKLSFSEIEGEIANMGKKAREGKLSMADLSGGTFSISNGGVYGSLLSTPIINPPQSGILGIHKTQDRPVAIAGKVEIRPMMYIALSYDHRIIDGKEAVTFLIKIKEAMENPERLLLGI